MGRKKKACSQCVKSWPKNHDKKETSTIREIGVPLLKELHSMDKGNDSA